MWKLSDIVQDKPVKVFSLFSCGGGSCMGYKKAGFNVIGNVELDAKVNEMYVNNLHPKYNYNMDIRDFIDIDIPEELKGIDILDGSPPCTTFSTAGQREKVWNKAKKFHEGQKVQTLDDLFMVYLDAVEKIQPKIFIAENVTGLIKGNAQGYVNEILNRIKELGYDVQMFVLNSAFMGVPQRRERVFFVGNRMKYPKLKLNFNEEPITFGSIKSPNGKHTNGTKTLELLNIATEKDKKLADILMRTEHKMSRFGEIIIWDNDVSPTLTTNGFFRGNDKSRLTDEDIIHIQTFPDDYDFKGKSPQYICGMSVPPIMMEHIANEIWKQWLSKDLEK